MLLKLSSIKEEKAEELDNSEERKEDDARFGESEPNEILEVNDRMNTADLLRPLQIRSPQNNNHVNL